MAEQLTIAERALRFHRLNPHVYAMCAAQARKMLVDGQGQLDIGGIWEDVRQESEGTRGESLKLNNDFRAFYARMLTAQEPDLAGCFKLRRGPHTADYAALLGRRFTEGPTLVGYPVSVPEEVEGL